MNGPARTERMRVEVDVAPSEGFDAVARALGYVKERKCRMAREDARPDRDVAAWSCSECGAPTYGDDTPSFCQWCGGRVVGAAR